MNESKFFTPGKLGPLTLRNRSIRAAAFEGMCNGHAVSNELISYHRAVAAGGVGMSTVAYASVSKSGLSFAHQLWMRSEILPDLRKLTDAIHREGAAASIQLGHCGNMANPSVIGGRPMAPSARFNLYGPSWPRKMQPNDIKKLLADFENAVQLAAEAGFDAVEIHAGHGYLISQFLSPFTNKRKDEYGGRFENRSRLMREVLAVVRNKLPARMALLVKMNSSDGFEGGITADDAIETAKQIEHCGADAVIVSGGFVSRAPMYVMRGAMPTSVMAYFMKTGLQKILVKMAGGLLVKPVPYSEGFFLEAAQQVKQAVGIPVVAVGGMNSIATIEQAMQQGFEFVAIARALIENPNFIHNLQLQLTQQSPCTICNYCVAKIYSTTMSCQLHEDHPQPDLKTLIGKLRNE